MPYDFHAPTHSFYIHWPFENHDCQMEQYHRALCTEIESFGRHYLGLRRLDTLFIGGGGASTYPSHLLLDMSGTLKDIFFFSDDCEITLEIDPNSMTKEKLELWKNVGINRLSFNVQNKSGADMIQRVEPLIKKAALLFDNLSLDFSLGVPFFSPAEWRDLVARIVMWPIQHLSVYFFDRSSADYSDNNQLSDEAVIDLYQAAVAMLSGNGFVQYELSYFAKPGYQSRQQLCYWDYRPYKGFGVSAASFDGKRRLVNQETVQRYMNAIQSGRSAIAYEELLTAEQRYLEKLMLGLRRPAGVLVETLIEELAQSQRDKFENQVVLLQEKKLLRNFDGRIALTAAGLLVENEVIMHFVR